jgi:hypothetical protein
VTGLLYFDASKLLFVDDLGLVDEALFDVFDEVLRPNQASLDALNAEFLA